MLALGQFIYERMRASGIEHLIAKVDKAGKGAAGRRNGPKKRLYP